MVEGFDSKIADINQADFGRKEIEIAEVEMPGKLISIIYLVFYRTHGLQKRVWREIGSQGCQNFWIITHDHPDCRFDRDLDRPWC